MKHDLSAIMTQRNIIQQNLAEGRATGRTTRIVNKIVDDFYSLPMGTPIPVIDHDQNPTTQSKKYIKDKVSERLYNIQGVQWGKDRNGNYTITRTTPTYREEALKNLQELNETLHKYGMD